MSMTSQTPQATELVGDETTVSNDYRKGIRKDKDGAKMVAGRVDSNPAEAIP